MQKYYEFKYLAARFKSLKQNLNSPNSNFNKYGSGLKHKNLKPGNITYMANYEHGLWNIIMEYCIFFTSIFSKERL